MKVGIIQQHNTADVESNKQRLAVKIGELTRQGAELIVLQELHNGLYFCQEENVSFFDLAESIPGKESITNAAYTAHSRMLKIKIATLYAINFLYISMSYVFIASE